MSEVLAFMGKHYFLTFFLAYIAATLIFRVCNRILRAINIYKNGYPPPHCDADGDF